MKDAWVVILWTFLEAILGFVGWLIWDALDKRKVWAIEKNTNTGRVRIKRRKPSHEAYVCKAGKESVLVKLEQDYIFGHSNRGAVFIVDIDPGSVQRIRKENPGAVVEVEPGRWRIKASEGQFEGLDGVTWFKFLKSGIANMIANSANGNLKTLLVVACCLAGAALLVGLFVASNFLGGSA